MLTVRDQTFELLRKLNIKTIFGNPGSTEETFLQNFPKDFKYIQVLQEASAVAAADGYAQATGTVGLVNVHTSAGLSNAMSNIFTAQINKTPLIITAGNQTREMLLMEPWLTNTHPEELPKPFVKWSYEPKRAEDVPAAFMRAYAMAIQEPAGPVFLSIPLDDWNKVCPNAPVVRTVSQRIAADPDRLAEFAEILTQAKNPVLIYGADIAKHNGWKEAIAFAEKMQAPVWAAPSSERTPFPENHPLYAGGLPFATKPLSDALIGHDVALIIGAPVFRYYPYVPGDYLPQGLRLLHISDDITETAKAPVGDSLISHPVLALSGLNELITPHAERKPVITQIHKKPVPCENTELTTLSAFDVFTTVRKAVPENTILMEESPSNLADLHAAWPVTFHDGFYTAASGSLGWNVPAAIGVALAEKESGNPRPVVAIIGDGSFQYSIQGIWTARQQQLPIIYIVPVNKEYAILKSFADCQATSNVPGLDIPHLDMVSLAKGYGCIGKHADSLEELFNFCREALKENIPTIIEIPITKTVPTLY
jgi:benzoylformate decarboxylase